MKRLVLCSVFLLLANFAIAKTNTTITETVKDAKTGKVIPDVSIIIQNLTAGTTTNSKGYYTIVISESSNKLRFSKVGYKTLLKTINSNQKKLKQEVLNVGKLPIQNIDTSITTNSVNSKLLQLRNVTDLGDAAKSATGVRPINKYGGFQTFRIRGFNNFVLLIDSVKDERYNISTSAPTTNLANVERIEVLKGPASVLYGHSVLGGIINIVRKKPTTEDNVSFNTSYGSFDTYNMAVGFGGSILDKLRYRTDFGITRTNDWRDYGVATNNRSFSFKYTSTSKNKFEFYAQANNDKYDTDTGIPVDDDGSLVTGMNPETRYNDPQDFLKHKRFDFQLKYTHEFNSNFKLTNLLSYSDDDINYLSTEFLEFNSTKDELARSFLFYFNHQTKTLQNQLDFSYTTTIGNIKNKILFGNSMSFLDRKTFIGSVIGSGTFTTITEVNPILNQGHIEPADERLDITDETASGFHIQDWLELSDPIKALIGLRYHVFEGTYYRNEIDNDRNLIAAGNRTDISSEKWNNFIITTKNTSIQEGNFIIFNKKVFAVTYSDSISNLYNLDKIKRIPEVKEYANSIQYFNINNPIIDANLLDKYDNYYFSRHNTKELPIIRVNTKNKISYYVNPKTTKVVYKCATKNRIQRWIYHGLHSLDFSFLIWNRPLWDITLIC
ncbi:MAG: TonB-dependent receptor [Flavobacteriaceae bacterium]|nr:TonB-dependent receptor [Flavobacteriaceae bacterium]